MAGCAARLQTTNLLLDCGDLALITPTDKIPEMQPLQWAARSAPLPLDTHAASLGPV
jgi:hypothetical protein